MKRLKQLRLKIPRIWIWPTHDICTYDYSTYSKKKRPGPKECSVIDPKKVIVKI